MKKKVELFCIILLESILLISCIFSVTPQLLSIEFIDDRTVEYEFSVALGSDYSGVYNVDSFSAKPNDDYRIISQEFFSPKGKIYFDKDIPDGVVFSFDFVDDNGKYVLTHSFTKGK